MDFCYIFQSIIPYKIEKSDKQNTGPSQWWKWIDCTWFI